MFTIKRTIHRGQIVVLSALFANALVVLACAVLRTVALELPDSLSLTATAHAFSLAISVFSILLPVAALLTAFNLSLAAAVHQTPGRERSSAK